ncbi:glycosyltransferase [Luedemannella helvata]|uniref:Glycosyltransferase family 1 protein n=1 Tax=Luedemannella helvata TaxID=349315 RepID=A0ABN2K6V5_9ACTN
MLFVDPELSMMAKLRRPDPASGAPQPGLHVLGPRLARLVPMVTPGNTRPGLRSLVQPLIKRAVRSALADLFPGSAEPVAAEVTCQYGWYRFVDSRHRMVYIKDDYVLGAELFGETRERMSQLEDQVIANVDTVAAVSLPLRDRLVAAGHQVELIPNGCDPDVYAKVDDAPPPADAPLRGPVAGLVGQINDRLDIGLLEAVADTGAPVLVVGPIGPGYDPARFLAFTERPNVCWVGGKPFEELPSYLRLIDVGLVPYVDNAFNRASFPLKTLEYLSAGRAVVSTPLPANDWLATDLIDVATGPGAFAASVVRALREPRTDALAQRRRAFAREHTWQRRADQLARLAGIGRGHVPGPHPS